MGRGWNPRLSGNRPDVAPIPFSASKGLRLCTLRITNDSARAGLIVNIAFKYGLVPSPDRATYCATKAAVAMLTKVLAMEWAQDSLRVNAIAPGLHENRFHHGPGRTKENRTGVAEKENAAGSSSYARIDRPDVHFPCFRHLLSYYWASYWSGRRMDGLWLYQIPMIWRWGSCEYDPVALRSSIDGQF